MKRALLHIVLFVLLYVAVLFGVEFLGFATPFSFGISDIRGCSV